MMALLLPPLFFENTLELTGWPSMYIVQTTVRDQFIILTEFAIMVSV